MDGNKATSRIPVRTPVKTAPLLPVQLAQSFILPVTQSSAQDNRVKTDKSRDKSREAMRPPKTPKRPVLESIDCAKGNGTKAALTTMTTTPSISVKATAVKVASSTLKAHIAKARMGLQKSVVKSHTTANTYPILSVDSPDPFVEIADPFNQQTKKTEDELAVERACERAREVGALNISCIVPRQIPNEVYSIYQPPANVTIDFESDAPKWYEVTELTRFIAADNEIEMIDDRLVETFPMLQHLDLHNNLLISMPQSILCLERLTSINLANNRLENDALDLIVSMPALAEINLSNNSIRGTPTCSFQRIPNLCTLDLSRNSIESIDRALGTCIYLRQLNLSHNVLTILASSTLTSMAKIEELNLSHNRMHGPLFDSIELTNLKSLDLSYNEIEKMTTPNANIKFPNLGQLSLAQNKLTGTDRMLCGAPKVQILSLAGNALARLPSGLCDLSDLRSLDISDNQLCTLDPRLGLLPNLQHLVWQGNTIREKGWNLLSSEEVKQRLRMRLSPG